MVALIGSLVDVSHVDVPVAAGGSGYLFWAALPFEAEPIRLWVRA